MITVTVTPTLIRMHRASHRRCCSMLGMESRVKSILQCCGDYVCLASCALIVLECRTFEMFYQTSHSLSSLVISGYIQIYACGHPAEQVLGILLLTAAHGWLCIAFQSHQIHRPDIGGQVYRSGG